MDKKRKVAVVFGGKSGEHEVSLMSATNVIKAMDKDKYDIHMIGINKQGRWMEYKGDVNNIQDGSWEEEAAKESRKSTVDLLFSDFFNSEATHSLIRSVDVIFPVLHGPNGEDGTVQGLFQLLDIPYVGCGVLASALGMDKALSKQIFKSVGLSVGPYVVLLKKEIKENINKVSDKIEADFQYPVFIKPANMGSSVGITKAHNRESLQKGLLDACSFDRKIIVEASIQGRELECAVLGNDSPKASGVGEIIPSHEFYDYEAKYFDGDNSKVLIPADLSEEKAEEIKAMAVKAYKSLDCAGLARADFFMEHGTNKIYINELNTLPGFTRISMYPKLWDKEGLKYSELIDQLIEYAIERYEDYH